MKSDNWNFFQIYLSDDGLNPPSLFEPLAKGFQSLFSDYCYQYFHRNSLRECLVQNFSEDVVWAYDQLRPYAYKADLARYCLLYKFGGWYADISLKPAMGCKVTNKTQLVYFYDHGQGPYMALHACQNGFIYAKKGHALMKDLIERIIDHCRRKYYGVNPLSPTGPTLFGEMMAKYVPDPYCHYGHFMQLTPYHPKKNLAYVGPEGDVFAFHKTAWNHQASSYLTLEDMGATGVNDYAKMWFDKDVYN